MKYAVAEVVVIFGAYHAWTDAPTEKAAFIVLSCVASQVYRLAA